MTAAPNLERVAAVSARRAATDAAPIVSDLERSCVGALLLPGAGDEIDRVLDVIAPHELEDPRYAVVLVALARMRAAGLTISLPALADEIHRDGKLDAIGGALFLAELADYEATPALAVDHARRARRHSLERRKRSLHARAVGDGDAALLAELAKVQERIDELDRAISPPRDDAPDLERVSFSGERLLALLGREAPPPVQAARPVPGHLMTLIAPPMVGKTTLGLWNGMARAAGVAPWPGVEARPAGRVLIYSIDEAPEQVVRRMNSLAIFHPAGQLAKYAERLVVIGPDRDVDPAALEALRFDEAGIATLDRWLTEAASAGDPFTELYVDAYADVIPLGETENSNEEATRIGGALERLAVRHGCAIVLLHHVGKPPKGENAEGLPDVRYLGRGASALAAKARAVTSLEMVSGLPHLRRVRTATNLGPTPRDKLFEVCSPETAGEELLFFRPAADPALRDPGDLLAPGEEINSTDLARRLAGDSLADDAPIPGDIKRLAASLRESWRAAGKVVVAEGPRRSKLIRLADAAATA